MLGNVFHTNKPKLIEKILDDAGVGQVDFDYSMLDAEFADDKPDLKSLIALTQNVQVSTSASNQNEFAETGSLPSASYRMILENVVEVARKRVRLGIFETGKNETQRPMGEPAIKPLPNSIIQELSGNRSGDSLLQIGAVGELYVSQT